MTGVSPACAADVLCVDDVGWEPCARLLARYGLTLLRVETAAPIPGSYWGEPEAGLIGTRVYARDNTPLHSLLHEACHLIVAPPERRNSIHTDASESQAEENAACYLQILLADAIPGAGRGRLIADMDAWGYTFRLGSSRAWFESDAEDARAWLDARGLLADACAEPAYVLACTHRTQEPPPCNAGSNSPTAGFSTPIASSM
jgi:hypothetical protein